MVCSNLRCLICCFIPSQLYQKCGQIERSFAILEGYLEGHQDEADLSVINLLVSMLMQNNAYERALQHIEQAHAIYYSGKELPINLKTKSGICHIHLGDIEKAEVYTFLSCAGTLFSFLMASSQ